MAKRGRKPRPRIPIAEGQAVEVRKLFNEGFNLREIRLRVFGAQKDAVHGDQLLQILQLDSWEDFRRERRRITQKIRREANKVGIAEEKQKGIKSCPIMGETQNLVIHHIDENYRNGAPHNLITISQKLHRAIHHPKQTDKARLEKYTRFIREIGYPEAEIKYCHRCKGHHVTSGPYVAP